MGKIIDQELEALAHQVFETVCAELSYTTWISAILDVRYKDLKSTFHSKLRVATDDGQVSLSVGTGIKLSLISLNESRTRLKNIWYGVTFVIDSESHCQINLNYDPACFLDESFFEH